MRRELPWDQDRWQTRMQVQDMPHRADWAASECRQGNAAVMLRPETHLTSIRVPLCKGNEGMWWELPLSGASTSPRLLFNCRDQKIPGFSSRSFPKSTQLFLKKDQSKYYLCLCSIDSYPLWKSSRKLRTEMFSDAKNFFLDLYDNNLVFVAWLFFLGTRFSSCRKKGFIVAIKKILQQENDLLGHFKKTFSWHQKSHRWESITCFFFFHSLSAVLFFKQLLKRRLPRKNADFEVIHDVI